MIVFVAGTIVLAAIHDASGTAILVVTALSARGNAWVAKKVTERIDMDASQIIDFTGWSIAGVSIVGIIGNAMGSLKDVIAFMGTISEAFGKVAAFVDKIVFWN